MLAGHKITRVDLNRKNLRFPFPDNFARRLEGRTVLSLRRRAKYLLADIEGGDVLIAHLGMTGRFIVAKQDARSPSPDGAVLGDYVYDTGAFPQHDHVVFHTSNGWRITYNDPRRFGFMLLEPGPTIDGHALFAKLGAEPLGDAELAEKLASRACRRKTDLKAFLMDQRNVAGLGNIYVSEALFRAGLSPTRRAATLAGRAGRATERADRLAAAIQSVLTEAVAAGGSTLRDYRQADGAEGAFQEHHAVYDRAGLGCRRPGCSGQIRRRVQAARATYHCPVCQR